MESELKTANTAHTCECPHGSSSGGCDSIDSAAETATETPTHKRGEGPDRRGEKRVDRRCGLDRRQLTVEESGYEGPDRRKGRDRRVASTLERRRGPGRRLSDIRKAAEEGEMTVHQFEFVMAIETYKKMNKRIYPSWTEILEIVHQLGYRKIHHRAVKLEAPEPELTTQSAA